MKDRASMTRLELELQNRELQEAQQALEESRNRYRELYDFAPIACVTLDERACLQELNLAGAALLGQERSALQGQSLRSFVEPSDLDRFLLHLQRCLAGGTPSTELRLRVPQGRLAVRLHGAPVGDGRPGRRMCRTAIIDLTELRRVQVRLSLAERMATVGTIAAGIAHEVNNPLAFLMGNLTIATRELRTHALAPAEALEQALQALRDAQGGAERIQEIIKDLGALARPSEPRTERLHLEQVLELSVKMAMVEIRPRAQLVRDYAEVPEVLADRSRLLQVFLNLLVNAAQSIPEGTAEHREIRLRIRSEEPSVLVQIQDTGEGLSPGTLEHLFEPFSPPQELEKNLGLGLTISHDLVSRMGATLHVESTPGQGSTFSLRLPAAPGLPRPPAPATAPSQSAAARSGRILIVDDELRFGQTLQLLLGRSYHVTYTPSARAALSWLDEGNRYDVVLCDLMMSEMTGKQFYEALCQRDPELSRSVIFMTGGAYTPASLEFVAQLTQPLLNKPFKHEELEKLLLALLPAV